MTQPKSLNISKGGVRNWELARTDPDQILVHIFNVQCIIVKINQMEDKTNTFI